MVEKAIQERLQELIREDGKKYSIAFTADTMHNSQANNSDPKIDESGSNEVTNVRTWFLTL